MLDMSWSEILVILVVALIVIGPKDLPKVIREVGKWTGKARSMARDFQRSFDDMVREAELDEIRQSLDKARPGNLKNTVRDMIDPDGELKRAFDINAEGKAGKAAEQATADAAPPKPAPAPALSTAPAEQTVARGEAAGANELSAEELGPPLPARAPMVAEPATERLPEPVNLPDMSPSHDEPKKPV